jgi:prephenate dehydratase
MKIGVLGPEGTFSETAALLWRTERQKGARAAVELTYHDTIVDVAESIVRNDVAYGIVPIENSLEGPVGETLDILSSENAPGQLQIVGEVLVPIHICLLAKDSFEKLRTVLSHPHAMAQCKQFIRERLRARGIKVNSVESTARAAQLAKEIDAIGALASEAAARKYGLQILARNVQDRESVTRFVVLAPGGAATAPSGRDKTSLLIALKDRPGALYDALGEFAHRGINLTKIESRPSKRALGDYMFHIDCEGHIEDERIKAALPALERHVTMLKILGSYPAAAKPETEVL